MAQLLIHFNPRPAPGQRVFYVALASDEDSTPSEHERNHRQIIGKLFLGLDLNGGDPNVEVGREKPRAEPSLGCSCGDGDYQVIDLG
jgi:hypothetical protein